MSHKLFPDIGKTRQESAILKFRFYKFSNNFNYAFFCKRDDFQTSRFCVLWLTSVSTPEIGDNRYAYGAEALAKIGDIRYVYDHMAVKFDAPKEWLTRKEAAEYMRTSTRMISRLVAEKKLLPVVFGNRWLFRRTEIDAFLESLRKG